jgi:hypothetical protein
VAYSKWESRKIGLNKQAELETEVSKLRMEFGSKLKTIIHVILQDFHNRYFRDEVNEDAYKHRTTLFVCLDCSDNAVAEKRLVIYDRIGVHSDSRCYWLVDENEPEKCRGMAGKIWFHGTISAKTALVTGHLLMT